MFQQLEVYNCKFEIVNGDNKQVKNMQAPRLFIEQQFLTLVQQAARVNSPVKIKLSRPDVIYDNFEQKFIEHENSITFMNNAYVSKEGV
jgi:hypothetical protein